MNLSVVIPTHNRKNDLLLLIESLGRQSLDNLELEVIVVSNLHDSSLEKVLKGKLNFPLRYFSVGAVGVNKARNRGIREAVSSKIYFLDDDVLLEDSFHLKKIYEYSLKNPEVGAFGGGYFLPEKTELLDEVYHFICTSWLEDKNTVYLIGGNTLYNKDLLKEDLHFNDALVFGGSETELNLKLRAKGHKLLYTSSLSIKHSTHLHLWDFIKKATRQGMGRSFHEKIPNLTWSVDTNNPQLFLEKTDQYYLAKFYFVLYDFFFHVGYRHGKKTSNGPLSISMIILCILQTIFQVDADKVLFIPNPKAKPFHKESYPTLKFREFHHWMKGNVWWRIPNYIVWQLIPLAGTIIVSGLHCFIPFNTIGLRAPYNEVFNNVENYFKKD